MFVTLTKVSRWLFDCFWLWDVDFCPHIRSKTIWDEWLLICPLCREGDVAHGSSSKSYCICSVEALSLSYFHWVEILIVLSQQNIWLNLTSGSVLYAREYNQVLKNRMKSLFRTYRFSTWFFIFFFPSSSQLERSYQRFTAFYASRHSGRKLTWLYHLSKGELVTNCFKNRYTLQVRQCCVKLRCSTEAACAWKH